MYQHETFPNAPITEAVVDFSVAFSSPLSLPDLDKYGPAAGIRFPRRRERRRYATTIAVKDGVPTWNNEEEKFVSFSSDDEKYVAQVRTGSFAFSRLKPYISWQDFEAKALDAWNIYFNTFEPVKIIKISLKYINRIFLKDDVIDFSRYFYTGIKVPLELDIKIGRAFFSFQTTNDQTSDLGEVTFATDTEASKEGVISVLFNVETIRPNDTPIEAEKIMGALGSLRKFKNDLFFCSVTEETKRLFR